MIKVIRKCLLFLVVCSIVVIMGGLLCKTKPSPLEAELVSKAIGIPYGKEDIAVSNKRPNQERTIKYIVIHNTANRESSAQNEVDYLQNANNTSSTSFHIAVDDREIIEAIPPTEIAFHAGTKEGNQYGIGIEICESGDYEQAEENAAKLTAYLMKYYDIPIENVKTHQDFSGKACPRLILDHWGHFKGKVERHYETIEVERPSRQKNHELKHQINELINKAKAIPLWLDSQVKKEDASK